MACLHKDLDVFQVITAAAAAVAAGANKQEPQSFHWSVVALRAANEHIP